MKLELIWTEAEIEILRKYYPESSWEELLKLLPNRKKLPILCKVSELKIRKITFFGLFQEHMENRLKK